MAHAAAQAAQEGRERTATTAMRNAAVAPPVNSGETTIPMPGSVGAWNLSAATIAKSMAHHKRMGEASILAKQTRKRVARQRMLRHAKSGDEPYTCTTWEEVKTQRTKRPWFCVLEGGRPWEVVLQQAQDMMRHASRCVHLVL